MIRENADYVASLILEGIEFLTQTETSDFVLYYFSRQYAWNFFPEKSKEFIQQVEIFR